MNQNFFLGPGFTAPKWGVAEALLALKRFGTMI